MVTKCTTTRVGCGVRFEHLFVLGETEFRQQSICDQTLINWSKKAIQNYIDIELTDMPESPG